MSDGPTLLPAELGQRLAQRLRRRDPAAEDEFNLIALEARSTAIIASPGRDRVDLLFAAHDADEIVPSLPLGVIAAALDECHDDERPLLLVLAEAPQISALLDRDCWGRDGQPNPDGAAGWLELLATAEEDQLATRVAAAEPDLIALWLRPRLRLLRSEEQIAQAFAAGKGWAFTPGDIEPLDDWCRIICDRLFTQDPEVWQLVAERLYGAESEANDEVQDADDDSDRSEADDNEDLEARLLRRARRARADRLADLELDSESAAERLLAPIANVSRAATTANDPDSLALIVNGRANLLAAAIASVLASGHDDDIARLGRRLAELHGLAAQVWLTEPDQVARRLESLLQLGLCHRYGADIEAIASGLPSADLLWCVRAGAALHRDLAERADVLRRREDAPQRRLDREPAIEWDHAAQRLLDGLREPVVELSGQPIADPLALAEAQSKLRGLEVAWELALHRLPLNAAAILAIPSHERWPDDELPLTVDQILAANAELALAQRWPQATPLDLPERARLALGRAQPDRRERMLNAYGDALIAYPAPDRECFRPWLNAAVDRLDADHQRLATIGRERGACRVEQLWGVSAR